MVDNAPDVAWPGAAWKLTNVWLGNAMAEAASFSGVELALIGAQQPPVLAELERRFVVHKVYAEPDPFATLARIGGQIRGAVGHGMAGLTRRHIELMPKLEICALNGVGLETSDLPAIRERGIVLTTTPVLFDDVADLAIALALWAAAASSRSPIVSCAAAGGAPNVCRSDASSPACARAYWD